MKKLLFVSLFFLFQLNNLFAQEAPKVAKAETLITEKNLEKMSVLNNFLNSDSIRVQIEQYKINSQTEKSTFLKRKGKTKRKFKSKYGFLNLNFAEHVFRTFTC
jgi:hypothetical protein